MKTLVLDIERVELATGERQRLILRVPAGRRIPAEVSVGELVGVRLEDDDEPVPQYLTARVRSEA